MAVSNKGSKANKMEDKKSSKYNNPVQKAVATYADWNTSGKKFGGGDIKTLQSKGLNANQIMKIATGIGNMTGVSNRANTMLTAGLPNPTKPGKSGPNPADFANSDDALMSRLAPGLARQGGFLPKKQLKWGGMTAEGKPMALSGMDYSKDLYGSGKAYTWTPGKGLSEPSLNKLMTGSTTPTASTASDSNTVTADMTTADTAVADTATSDMAMPSWSSAVANSAQGFRSKKSSRQRAGRSAQGLASTRTSPSKWTYNL